MAIITTGDYHAIIHDRGGKRRVGELKGLNQLTWHRVRDDMSDAKITLNADKYGINEKLFSKLAPGRHELCLYRGDDRVWEGPLSLPTFTRDTITIAARDVTLYWYRTIMHAGYSSAYPNIETVVGRAERIAIAELARKEALGYNLLDYLHAHHSAGEAETSRVTLPYQMTLFEHIDDMAAKSGMDYTVLGRAVHLWDTSHSAMGRTAVVTENDFLSDVHVSYYGMELATFAAVTDGQGLVGTAGGDDPFYGEWEVLATAYDETDGVSPPSSAELTSQAQRNLSGRNPVPMQIRVPDNSSLNPNGVLKITDLVPGIYIPLRATLSNRKIQQVQKLDALTVDVTDKGEDLKVTMYPAAREDVVV